MSSSKDMASKDMRPAATANDEYGWIDRYAADLHRSAKELVTKGEAARVSDEALAQIITAAVRLYYAKSELEDRAVPAIVQEGGETVTATEMLVAVSEMLRDVQLGRWNSASGSGAGPARTSRTAGTELTQAMVRGASHESASDGRAADAADAGHRHLDRQPRDPQACPSRCPPAQAA